MTKDELKFMIDETINSNGTRGITGKSLNLALSQIVEAIGEEFDSEEVVIERNDVNFFDYDGTLLYSYTWEEAKNLTELPPLPTHEGLDVREWNYTLEDIKAQGGTFTGLQFDANNEILTKNGEIIIDGIVYDLYVNPNLGGYITQPNASIGDSYQEVQVMYDDNYINVIGWSINKYFDGGVILDKFEEEVIGKADVGACVYDSNGEQMLGSNVLIIERGETYLPDIYGQMFAVVSIPNTITIGGAPSLNCCQFFGELKLPISLIPTSWDNYSFIMCCVVDSIHINGLPYTSNGYWYQCTFRDIYIPQNSFIEEGRLTYDVISPYIKILPHISYISEINTNFHYGPSDFCIIDCSDYTYVPELGYARNGCLVDPDIVIVPDELYDEWVNATNWANIGDNIKPASECKNIIRK